MATEKVNVLMSPGTKYDKVVLADKTFLKLEAQEEIVIIDEALDDRYVYYKIVVTKDVEYVGL